MIMPTTAVSPASPSPNTTAATTASAASAVSSSTASNAAPPLDVRDVSFAYPGRDNTLNGVSFTLARGEMAVLLGPNGSGKSTLLNCIMNLLTPQSGAVYVNGAATAKLSHREIAAQIAYVPQTTQVNFAYSVRDYVVMGRTPFMKMYETPSAADYRICDESLEQLGISDIAERPFNELSGGQQQLANVARALTQKPDPILFDEPTSALDYGNQIKVLSMVKSLSLEGHSILMTTHNPDHPILLDATVCILGRDGRLSSGAVEDMDEDTLASVYDADVIIRYVDDAHRRVCMTRAFE